ncbi:DUF899 domain-containing protein [Solirubrobacter phytolaccae]|uniref:DUF899 domain-containing protein n=1 Tax=Solirubrobacter phytolaccae TaxID=1404360 RepID=A0A9X3N881_9ACTN|nr:DUF899 domain-containing protein [Solirubrobacter phytolaccae]MDA0181583.1 DUF899 domain-containing protein [Solirubrobacter phytolaccae]
MASDARLALLDREKELTRLSDELARERAALPWEEVTAEYRFDTEHGSRTLAELFDGRSQLLVYHFMYGPETETVCASCTSIAHHVELPRVYLEHHDVTWTAVSRAPLEKLLAYRERMGWTFPWASSSGSDFNFDFGVSNTPERPLREYNFRPVDPAELGAEQPGMSAFALRDGKVFHTYSAYSRGLDAIWGIYQWLDRAPLGRNEGDGYWFKRPDEF